MIKILTIIGARPQFIKHYPFELAAKGKVNLVTLHTGQHYDENMSQIFFNELGMDKPTYQLNLGGGRHGEQTGKMIIEIEKIATKEAPQYLVVYGDTNSTLAGALVASKLHIPLVHIESGLRSYNKKMPEEINRLLTDHISELLFVPSQVAIENLNKEGIFKNIFLVGDIMKDLVLRCINERWIEQKSDIPQYVYVTLHRPYNTDIKSRLIEILDWLDSLAEKSIFSLHPRTRSKMLDFGLSESNYKNIDFIDPQSYFSNLSYLANAKGLITDSGGMQKEAYWLKKKCFTIRSETEWLETLKNNTNTLLFENLPVDISFDVEKTSFDDLLYGDGKAAEVIIDNILNYKI